MNGFFERNRWQTLKIHQFWDLLTGPATAVYDDSSRRNARLIATIILLLLLAATLERLLFRNVPLWVLPVLGVAYILSRTRFFSWAAIITVLTLSLPTYFAVINSSYPNTDTIALDFAWLVFPLLISGLFFSVRGVIIVTVSTVLGILLMPLFSVDIRFLDILLALNFVGAFSLLVVIVKYQRNRLETGRLNELSANEERLRLALDAAQMGTWDWELESGNLVWSKQVAVIFGLEQDEFSGTLEDFTATIHPEDWESVEQAITQVVAGETEEFRVEHRVIFPDDTVRWVEGRGQIYRNENGRSTRMTGITTDITSRKQAEIQEINRKVWLEKVVELGKNVTQVNDWQTCLTTIHQSILEGLQFERVGLFLYDEEQDVVNGTLGTTLTGEIEDISHFSRPASVEGNFREVLNAPRGFVIISKPGDRFNKPPDHELHRIKEHATVAVWGREKPVAILTVDNAIAQQPMTETQLDALRIFAGYAGLAIENVRLFEQLQASERNYREIFNATNEAIFIHDAQSGKLLDVNEAVTSMYGCSYEEVLSAPPEKYSAGFEPYTAENITDYIQKSIAEGPQLFEWLARKQTGELFWVEIALKSTTVNEQSCVLAVVRDITHRKEAEKALRSEHEFRTSIINHASEGLCVYHNKEEFPYIKFTEWNDRMTQITGYTMAQVNGLGWSRTLFPDSKEWAKVVTRIQRVQKGENLSTESWEITRADGEKRVLNITTSILKEQSGQSHVLALVNDVTDIKLVEAEQQALIRELEAKNTELERFTYTVSHDLKSPLITIQGFLTLLEQDALSGNIERMKKDINHILEATNRMQVLLNELLKLSRIGRLVNPPESVSFSELVQEAVMLVSGQIVARNVQVIVAPDLPMVYGDRQRLLEVVQNLLDNSVKFMGAQPEPRVEIGAEIKGKEVLCHVRDNGIGIEPEYHDRVFDLFDRFDQSVEGTGIGLALVKRIVEVHDGKIWVESEGNGEGASFYFTLPGISQMIQE
jgi:two-component system sensor kinase FixL